MYTLNNAHQYNDYLIVHWLGWVSEDTTHCMELTLRGKCRPRSHDLAGYIIIVTIAHLTVSSTMVSFWATDDKLSLPCLCISRSSNMNNQSSRLCVFSSMNIVSTSRNELYTYTTMLPWILTHPVSEHTLVWGSEKSLLEIFLILLISAGLYWHSSCEQYNYIY